MDNIKMEISWGGMDWINLAQDRDQWRALVNTDETSDSVKFWEVLEELHDWPLLKKDSAPCS
jgi:hypothetical protein